MALKKLTERKRDVILLYFFMDMNDVEIAKSMNLVRSTVCEHRKRSLEILKEILKEAENAMDKRKKPLNRELPEYEVIQEAVAGNILAINQILDHYRGYIIKKSIRKLKDEYGNTYCYVDETLRQCLENQLVKKS